MDVGGRIGLTGIAGAESNAVQMNVETLSPGNYVLHIANTPFNMTKQFFKQ